MKVSYFIIFLFHMGSFLPQHTTEDTSCFKDTYVHVHDDDNSVLERQRYHHQLHLAKLVNISVS